MKIKIGEFDFSETWDGVFYKKLSHYPNITEWEMQSIFDFIKRITLNRQTIFLP